MKFGGRGKHPLGRWAVNAAAKKWKQKGSRSMEWKHVFRRSWSQKINAFLFQTKIGDRKQHFLYL